MRYLTERARKAVRALTETAERVIQTCSAAGPRPVTACLEIRERTLRLQAVMRAGNLSFSLDAAWGRETFFRLETVKPDLAP